MQVSLIEVFYYSLLNFFAIYPLIKYDRGICLQIVQLVCPLVFFIFFSTILLIYSRNRETLCKIHKFIEKNQYLFNLILLIIVLFILSGAFFEGILNGVQGVFSAIFWAFSINSQISGYYQGLYYEIIRFFSIILYLFLPYYLLINSPIRKFISDYLLNSKYTKKILSFFLIYILIIFTSRVFFINYIIVSNETFEIIKSMIFLYLPIFIINLCIFFEIKNHSCKKLFVEFLRIRPIYLILFITLFIFLFGLLGFIVYNLEYNTAHEIVKETSLGIPDITYNTLRLFSMNFDYSDNIYYDNNFLEFARFSSALIVIIGLILVYDFLIPDQLVAFIIGLSGEHTIICGLGEHGTALARKKIDEKRNIIVIEKDSNNENIASLRKEGALVIIGDAKQQQILKRAKITRANTIYILTGDDNNNLSILNTVRILYNPNFSRILTFVNFFFEFVFIRPFNNYKICCYLNIINSELCRGLKNSLSNNKDYYSNLDIHIINIDFLGGEILFNKYKTILSSQFNYKIPKICIIGTGIISDFFIVYLAHYFYSRNLNKSHGLNGKLSHQDLISITVFGENAITYKDYIFSKYPNLKNYYQIYTPLVEFTIENFLTEIRKFNDEQKDFDLIISCLDDELLAITAAFSVNQIMKVPTDIQNPLNYKEAAPIFVKISKNEILNEIFHSNKNTNFHSNITFFPIIDQFASHSYLDYDVYSGIIEWASSDYIRFDNQSYLINLIKGNEILYNHLKGKTDDYQYQNYPYYLLQKSISISDESNSELYKFLTNFDNCVTDLIISSKENKFESVFFNFEDFWSLVTKKFKIKPEDFYSELIIASILNYSKDSTLDFIKKIIELIIIQGSYEKAEILLNSVDINLLDTDYKKKYLLLQARIFQNRGNIVEFSDKIKQIKDLGDTHSDIYTEKILEIHSAILEKNHGKYEEAITKLETIVEKSNDLNLQKLSIMCYNEIGNIKRIQNKAGESIKYYEFVETNAKKIQDLEAITIAYNNLGLAYTVLYDYDKALHYHQKQLEISKKINYKKGLQRAWGNSAIIHRRKGNLNNAIINHIEEKKSCLEMKYRLGLASAYNNLAIVQIFCKINSAKKYLDKQLIIAHQLRDRECKALCYGNYAIYYYKMNQLEEAIKYNEILIQLSTNNEFYSALMDLVDKRDDDFSEKQLESSHNGNCNDKLVPEYDKYMNIMKDIKDFSVEDIDKYDDKVVKNVQKLIEFDSTFLLEYFYINKKISNNNYCENNEILIERGEFEDILDKAVKNKSIFCNELGRKNDYLNQIEEINIFDSTIPAPLFR